MLKKFIRNLFMLAFEQELKALLYEAQRPTYNMPPTQALALKSRERGIVHALDTLRLKVDE